MSISRRVTVFGLPLALSGCLTAQPEVALESRSPKPPVSPHYMAVYSAIETEPFPVPALDVSEIDQKFLRQEVAYSTREHPGTIVVDPHKRFLHLVGENGRAIRYGVGVGKIEAFNFQEEATIARKAEWPHWAPTQDMIAREPDRYGSLKDGLPGGPTNPLGPRALYLYRDGRDTLYRLHGTIEPWTIGTKVSSGCVRLLNQDIMDLYSRVPIGSKVVVLPGRPAVADLSST